MFALPDKMILWEKATKATLVAIVGASIITTAVVVGGATMMKHEINKEKSYAGEISAYNLAKEASNQLRGLFEYGARLAAKNYVRHYEKQHSN